MNAATTAGLSFEPVRIVRIHEQICSQIRDLLATGQLKPGDRLPPSRLLASAFGVSRAAVRDALRALESAGVISTRKGGHGGAVIRPRQGKPRRA